MKGLPGNRQPFFYTGKRLSHGFEGAVLKVEIFSIKGSLFLCKMNFVDFRLLFFFLRRLLIESAA